MFICDDIFKIRIDLNETIIKWFFIFANTLIIAKDKSDTFNALDIRS